MDVVKRIEQLRSERQWTMYMLSVHSGVPQSTLATIVARNTPPKIDILQELCEAFGITLAQFFLEDEHIEILSDKEKELLIEYRKLTKGKQNSLLQFLKN